MKAALLWAGWCALLVGISTQAPDPIFWMIHAVFTGALSIWVACLFGKVKYHVS